MADVTGAFEQCMASSPHGGGALDALQCGINLGNDFLWTWLVYMLLGGATIIGIAAFALGYETKKLFEKSKNKFMNSIRKHLWESLIANQLEDALAQQMQKTVFRLSCAFVSRKS